MMKNELQNDLPADAPDTDETAPAEKSWTLLYDRIRTLALRKSLSMLEEDETQGEEFDRGARALRTLMSAAEVSLRMKREEAKETGRHEPAREPEVTDDAIRTLKRKLERQGGDSWEGEVPLAELSERYRLTIFDGETPVRTVETAAPEYLYAEADIIADFGGDPGAALSFSVAQISDAVGEGAGSSANAALA